MSREFLERAFTVQEALAAGLTRRQLSGPRFRRVRRGIYVRAALPADPLLELDILARRLPPEAIFSGLTAAWLHGLCVGPPSIPDVTLQFGAGISGRAAMTVRRAICLPEAVQRRGRRATTVERTLADLAASLGLWDLVALMDEALHRRMTELPTLQAYAASNVGRPGAKVFRRAVELTDGGAESPKETYLRLLLQLRARLPRAQTNTDLYGPQGWVGRVDLYFPEALLAVEYDGSWHRENLVKDVRRQNLILEAGYQLLRYTNSDLETRSDTIIAQCRAAYRAGVKAARKRLAA